jgi:predicted dehydrogenase/sugar phosphate isomerase/epimerase
MPSGTIHCASMDEPNNPPGMTIANKLRQIKNRIGCSTLTFKDLPLIEALDKIKAGGFHSVDIGIVPCYCCHLEPSSWSSDRRARLLDELASRQLKVSSLNVAVGALPSRDENEPWTFTAKCLKIAADLGAYAVTISPGPAAEQGDWLLLAEGLAKRIHALADQAEGSGIRLSVESPHAGSLTDSYAESNRFFQVIADPRVGSTFDTSHAQRDESCSLKEGIQRIGAEIVHVHLRDALRKRFDLTPGKGACDYLPFIQELMERGYKGDLNIELECHNLTTDQIAVELEFARDYLHALLEQQPMPARLLAWKNQRLQFRQILSQTIRDPKDFIVQRPRLKALLKPVLKPLVKAFHYACPIPYTRFEVRWQQHWGVRPRPKIKMVRMGGHSLSNQKVTRVGILGCGTVGSTMHAPSFARLPGIEIVGVCDTQPRLADALAREVGCPAFYSLNELVSEAKPDLVANATKEWTHHSTTMFLLKNGIDVFCEKIMAEELTKGEAMVQMAAAQGRVLAVNFNWRFLPGIMKIKQIKDSGTLGELCILRFFCHSWVWHHALDLACYLGGDIASVFALIRQDPIHNDPRPWRRFADELVYLPGVCGMVMFESGQRVATCVTSSELWNPHSCLFNLDAVFRHGTISLSGIRLNDAMGVLSSDKADLDLSSDLSPSDGPSDFSITFQRSIQAFVRSYHSGQAPPVSGQDGLQAMKIERAVARSAASGQKVHL